ncbi:T9SS type A sorting domain-containing protein [Hymenobacter sp.]|uniref:T9SS type A sorting domain-containing protein n=1 Tax=Hymenobacter sp. TaxID=1898978 RepID=UPI00286B00B6|nr:T9SS type A sorting domain-containing protein [Hymenobacter sp.]
MRKSLLLLVFLTGTAVRGAAQTVSTPALTYPAGVRAAGDALSADAAGNLYASDYAGTGTGANGNGSDVLQITPAGNVSVFVALPAGSGPAGTGFDQAGNFYVAAYNTGIIYRRTAQGVLGPFVTGLNGPTGIVFDANNNLYVTITGTTVGGTTVARITPAGQVSTYASGFFYPGGLAFDSAGNLYVSNFVDGQIKRVTPAGAVSTFITLSGGGFAVPLGYLAVIGNNLYATNIGGNQIYRVNLLGTPAATVLAGTGAAGSTDGPAASARFDGPNGLAVADGGATLYVTETNPSPRRLRRITGLVLATGAARPADALRLGNYPNPAGAATTIAYTLPAPGPVQFVLRTATGQVVDARALGWQRSGPQQLTVATAALRAGCYTYTLTSAGGTQTRKLVIY